jgi:hypothetical protein
MPNWDRWCTACGFTGSYLDFRSLPGADGTAPTKQRCDRHEECGATVEWEHDDDE